MTFYCGSVDRRNMILSRRVLWSRDASGGVSVQHAVWGGFAVLWIIREKLRWRTKEAISATWNKIVVATLHTFSVDGRNRSFSDDSRNRSLRSRKSR